MEAISPIIITKPDVLFTEGSDETTATWTSLMFFLDRVPTFPVLI